MWTMNQWATFPFKDRMEKIVAARGYEPDMWSFAKPLFSEGKKAPSEEELVEMAQLATAGDLPSPRKPEKKKAPSRHRGKRGDK